MRQIQILKLKEYKLPQELTRKDEALLKHDGIMIYSYKSNVYSKYYSK